MDISALIQAQRAFFSSGTTLSLDGREMRLDQLRTVIQMHEAQILEALKQDLGKGEVEAYVSEIAFVLGEIRYALNRLSGWMSPDRRGTPLSLWPGRSHVHAEPLGVSLILGPWNYPFQLLMAPLVSALAAGNCVVLKPSEHAPETAKVVDAIITKTFAKEVVAVVTGDGDIAQQLLAEKWDKIFFTGSTAIGRKVMAAAAQHLTPVTLELGGKCPCIVAADAKLDVAARRIVWGKFMNAGQTCVAPDHVWVDRKVQRPLLEALKQAIHDFYGQDPQQSEDYGRVVNSQHHARLVALLEEGETEVGGQHDQSDRYISPTVLSGITPASHIMQDEIFGPILPVLAYDSIDQVYQDHQQRPSPLALYLFSESQALKEEVVARTRSGGVCINDTLSHLLNRNLPFGGVGESGMGAYHGKAGFDAFSHRRSVMHRGSRIDPDFRYPPIPLGLKKLKKILRWFGEG